MSASYLVLDIETGNAPDEAVEAAIAAYKPPRNIKDPLKITASVKEAAVRIADRAALLDASPVLCIAVAWDGNRCVFDGMGAREGVEGVFTMHTTNEREMLMLFGSFLDSNCDPDTQLAGHNVCSFDLPKLRMAFVRNGLKVPPALAPSVGCEIVDTAKLIKAYSIELRDEFCPSLDEMCRVLGIESSKGVISGSDVPRLHREGRFSEILSYCCDDVRATESAFLMMTGGLS